MVRMATVEDAANILHIYAYYIENTTTTFEYIVPSVAEFSERMAKILQKYPYLVYEENGTIYGYAYAHQFMERAASQWGAELSVYLAKEAQGKGIGKQLYQALTEILKLQHVVKLYGCIEGSNAQSIAMHKRLGFSEIARFAHCGYKHGKWLDLVWLEKTIADAEPSQPFLPISQIEKKHIVSCMQKKRNL